MISNAINGIITIGGFLLCAVLANTENRKGIDDHSFFLQYKDIVSLKSGGWLSSWPMTVQTDRARVKKFALSPPSPNPATTRCQVNILWYDEEARKKATLAIYDLGGNKISDVTHLLKTASSEKSSIIELDIANIGSGVYIILLSLVGSDNASSKLIIVR